jgi:hypothetical protein
LPTTSTTATSTAASQLSTIWLGWMIMPIETKKIAAKMSRSGRTSASTSWPLPDSAISMPPTNAPSATE